MSASLSPPPTRRFRAKGARHLDEIAARYGLPDSVRDTVRTAAMVLPFRVNDYVLENLVDWSDVPADPVFQLVFPQRGMLSDSDERTLAGLVAADAPKDVLDGEVRRIRAGMNPHPSGQRQLNVPVSDGQELPGMQHKYAETVLYFPSQGQSCHSYCTYCFRWAQFIGEPDLRFAAPGPAALVSYLDNHPAVSDVLLTGGDPMVMSTERLASHIEPLLDVPTVRAVRVGTKSVAYWPQRFVTDDDADDLLRLFERVVASGRTLAVMAHFTHPRELGTDLARTALARVRATGAVVYCQAPLVAHVNDDAAVWAQLWRAELAAGAVPYYMFVERDTGPHEYFKVPLARAADIFAAAYRTLSGLARTVRGPVMSATPGKVVVDGVLETPAGPRFQLRLLQARDPSLVGRPFLAAHDTSAAWLDDLVPDPSTPADIASAVFGAL